MATFFFVSDVSLYRGPGRHEMTKQASYFCCQTLDLRQMLFPESASHKLLELQWHLWCLDKEAIKIFSICLH